MFLCVMYQLKLILFSDRKVALHTQYNQQIHCESIHD